MRWSGVFLCLWAAAVAAGQDATPPSKSPGAPPPKAATPPRTPPPAPPRLVMPSAQASGSSVLAFLPPAYTRGRLAAPEKFDIYLHETLGPQNFLLPLPGAAFSLAFPPSRFPRAWKDGGGAFARWYGAQLATITANHTGQLFAEVAWHEDPRYVMSGSTGALARILHALAFTFVDKSDSGHNTVALSNFAGAAAGGFVGMGFLPRGYNDATHAEQRALRGLGTIALRNVATEFRPQREPILRKLRIPSILPGWWSSGR